MQNTNYTINVEKTYKKETERINENLKRRESIKEIP